MQPPVAQAFAQIFSTMHYMERIGLVLAKEYVRDARDDDQRAFAEAQLAEEGRHVSLCARLARRFGGLDPPSTWLRLMEWALFEHPVPSIRLMGLLGGDIMGDFLLERLLASDLPDDVKGDLRSVRADEERHIDHFAATLPDQLAALGPLDRLRSVFVQLVLLVADLFETRRLRHAFRAAGYDPDFESVLCYLYYKRQMKVLDGTGAVVMVPAWLVRLASGTRYREAEAELARMGHA